MPTKLVNVCGFRDTPAIELVGNKKIVNTTSRAINWSGGLSPFVLGPCQLYNDNVSINMENAWQYAKVYKDKVDINQDPTEEYFAWAKGGWEKERADRYPMGKGVIPLYSYWSGEKLPYIEARKRIYAPLYAKAVENTDAFKRLKEIYESGEEVWLWDFDGYDFRSKNMTYEDVLNNPKKKMGHAFVLAMMLENMKIWE